MIDITKNAWIAQTLDKFGYELSSILSLPYISLCQIEKRHELAFKKDQFPFMEIIECGYMLRLIFDVACFLFSFIKVLNMVTRGYQSESYNKQKKYTDTLVYHVVHHI